MCTIPYKYLRENYISPKRTSELNLADFPKLDKVMLRDLSLFSSLVLSD